MEFTQTMCRFQAINVKLRDVGQGNSYGLSYAEDRLSGLKFGGMRG